MKKGTTNNPNGRPAHARSLAEAIRRELNKTIPVDGRGMSRKRVLAKLMVEGATEGTVSFPDGRQLILAQKQWVELATKILNHIDGPPPTDNRHEVFGAINLVWNPHKPKQ